MTRPATSIAQLSREAELAARLGWTIREARAELERQARVQALRDLSLRVARAAARRRAS